MGFVQIQKCRIARRNTNILVVFPQNRYIEVYDLTNPRYNEPISLVSWHFVKSGSHCTNYKYPGVSYTFNRSLPLGVETFLLITLKNLHGYAQEK